jgi:glyoxalase superfamily protein
MATGVQVVFDRADPDGLARFWAEALGYKLQDPPAGYAKLGSLEEAGEYVVNMADPEGSEFDVQ